METNPASVPFIFAIAVTRESYPLYGRYNSFTTGTRVFFSTKWRYIYSGLRADASPVALEDGSTVTVQFSTEGFRHLKQLREPYCLRATLDGMPVLQGEGGTEIFGDDGFEMGVLFRPVVNGQEKRLPWGLRGNLTWVFQGSDETQPKYTTTTPIEIYVFEKNLPAYFNKGGIPLALLRLDHYLPTWMRTASWSMLPGHNVPFTWPNFVIHQVFSDTELEYEQWGGSCKYTSWDLFDTLRGVFTKNRGLDCWLDLWLSHRTETAGKQTVNCYDLAALCQILISLGVDATSTDLRMKYMDPFGFIHPTRLIGRSETPANTENPGNACNNPFYGNPIYDTRMLCPSDSPARSAFGNHMFLTISENKGPIYVLDACCGPQLGTEPLLEYPNTVIDATASLYPMPHTLGTLADITDGLGVENLVTSRYFDRPGSGVEIDPTSPALFNRLVDIMGADWEWDQPKLSMPAGVRTITATWTLRPKVPSPARPMETLTINIIKFILLPDLQNAFTARCESTTGWIMNGLGDVQNDTRRGSLRMFCDTQRLYLATIDAPQGKADSTLQLRTTLQTVINSCLPVGAPPTNYIQRMYVHDNETFEDPAEMPLNVDTHFVVRVEATQTGRLYWRGFNVRVSKGHVLFLSAAQTGGHGQAEFPPRIELEFLARSSGFDSAVITIYGGNLESESRTVNFWIA